MFFTVNSLTPKAPNMTPSSVSSTTPAKSLMLNPLSTPAPLPRSLAVSSRQQTPLVTSLNRRQEGTAAGVAPKFGFIGPLLTAIESNRTLELFVEDLIAMSSLRATWDYNRGWFYGIEEKQNKPAGLERVIREVCSFITDIFAAGLIAKGVGWTLDGFKSRKNGFSQDFASFKSLELFQGLLKEPGVKDESTLRKAFAQKLSQVKLKDQTLNSEELFRILSDEASYTNLKPDKVVTEKAKRIAQLMKQEHFDFNLGDRRYQLNALLEDMALIEKRIAQSLVKTTKTESSTWLEVAKTQLNKTIRNKNAQMLGIPIAAAMTFGVPFAIEMITRRFYNIKGNPAEKGLASFEANEKRLSQYWQDLPEIGQVVNDSPIKTLDKPRFLPFKQLSPYRNEGAKATLPVYYQGAQRVTDKSKAIFANSSSTVRFNGEEIKPPLKKQPSSVLTWFQRHMPFATEQVLKGNPIPALLSTIPSIIFASGLFFDMETRRFNSPFAKGFAKKYKQFFDFGKVFPYTKTPQIAALYGLLIIGRLSTSRTQIEFRERMVDSVFGWGLLIMGSPIMKRFFATKVFKEPSILKTDQWGRKVLKTGAEVAAFGTEQAKKAFTKVSRLGLLTNIVLLGIIEPIAAIYWTKAMGSSKAHLKKSSETTLPTMTVPVATASNNPLARPQWSFQPAVSSQAYQPTATQRIERYSIPVGGKSLATA